MSENKVTDPTTGEQVEVIDVRLYALNLAEDGRILSARTKKKDICAEQMSFFLEQVKGIEPSYSAWEAESGNPGIHCRSNILPHPASSFPPSFPPEPSRMAIPAFSVVESRC